MGARSSTNDRRAVVAAGAIVVTLVVAALLTTSADTRSPDATDVEPEIVMPAPQLGFDDLDEPPPPADATETATPGAPADHPATTAVRSLRISGAMTVDVRFTPLDQDRRATYTLTGTFFGDMTGEWIEEGTEQYGEVDAAGHVSSVGSGTATAELTVPGVGTGRVDSTNEWHSDNQGSVLGVSTITRGFGELVGVTGTMRWNSTDDAGTITYQLDLVLPGP